MWQVFWYGSCYGKRPTALPLLAGLLIVGYRLRPRLTRPLSTRERLTRPVSTRERLTRAGQGLLAATPRSRNLINGSR